MVLLILVVNGLPLLCSLVEVHSSSALPLLRVNESELRLDPRLLISAGEIIDGVLRCIFNRSISLLLVFINHGLVDGLFFVTFPKDRVLNGVFPIIQFILAEGGRSLVLLSCSDSVHVGDHLARTDLCSFVHCYSSEVDKIWMRREGVLV